jgi:integrase
MQTLLADGAAAEAENRGTQDSDHRAHRTSAVPQKGALPRMSHWPTGELTQVGKVKPSDCDVWLSRYRFGSASRNLYIGCLKELFALAVRDHIIVASPAAHLRSVKRETPIRLTPSYQKFKAIIADVRAQQFNADAQDSADFLEFLGLAGLGQAEANSLGQCDVDLDAGRILTFRHKTTTGFAMPVFPQVRPLLERLCESDGNRIQGCRREESASGCVSAARTATI